MKHTLAAFLFAVTACIVVRGATISISKDVRFTVGSPQSLFAEPSAIPEMVASTRDGGRLIAALVYSNNLQTGKLLLRRLDADGETVFTRDIGEANSTHLLNFIIETSTGEVVAGEQIRRGTGAPAVARLVKLGQAGEVLRDVSFGVLNFSRIVLDGEGFIIVGSGYQAISLLRLANDFTVQWQTNIPSSVYVYVAGGLGLTDLKRTPDGGLLYAVQYNDIPTWQTVKSRLDGGIEWKVSFPGPQISGANERLVGVYPLRKGGHILLYSSTIPPGALNPSPGWGGEDYRIIRVNTNGQPVWYRYYGGIESDEPRFLTETEDDGFIVGGYSRSVNISGNKGVAGVGTWCLKLDSLGLKEAEFILPGEYVSLLPKATGYSLVGGQPPGYTNFTTIDLNALRRVSITARAEDSRPFNMDVSTNLVDWMPFVIDFTGDLNLLESYTGERKFYRVRDQ